MRRRLEHGLAQRISWTITPGGRLCFTMVHKYDPSKVTPNRLDICRTLLLMRGPWSVVVWCVGAWR